ncbi:hypothetical protein EDD37DRAFT_604795 [Exophiala viscosa]|uniref:uncharacterized protein n=1 Tax=Exophiala viscosa TaxID=2486360 RepID=UPI00219234C7|nr:hypothetical protein EDD37DRAFT_604795 [Exophiala viscosa]
MSWAHVDKYISSTPEHTWASRSNLSHINSHRRTTSCTSFVLNSTVRQRTSTVNSFQNESTPTHSLILYQSQNNAPSTTMDVLSSLPPFQYLVAYFLPIMFIGAFISSFANPHAVTASVCFPQPADKPINAFVYLFAVRELVLGIALILLEACNEWRAVVILLACVGINGMGDFLLAGNLGTGWRSSFMCHGIPTIVCYWTVWKLWQEHF